jgi:cytidylate kinase
VVILGRGSQYILDDHPDAVHILLVNEFENRVKFMTERYEMTRRKAERTVVNEDRRRISLYKRLGKSDYENPLLYHMVLNMGRLDLETARNMVCNLAMRKMEMSAA